MTIAALFWLYQSLACAYAAWAGGKDGKWAAALLFAASVLSLPAARFGRAWDSTEYLMFGVDFALLVALWTFAVCSRRWWPIWLAGLHCNAVAAHIGSLIEPGAWARIYFAAESFWSVPMPLVMIIGITLDARAAAQARAARLRGSLA